MASDAHRTNAEPRSARRTWPIGAECRADGVHFRVWAPAARRVEVCVCALEGNVQEASELAAEDGGYFAGLVAGARAGQRYGFRLDGGERLLPDPASRFQPLGPHGLSEIVDPRTYCWEDADWTGPEIERAVVYEMHVGTFTPAGTFAAAAQELPELARLGVTLVELMPIADFPGRFGWGYDGVNLFAPTRLYGTADDFRRFVDRAHAVGVGVVLDVVYNHLGPDGNYLAQFSPQYLSRRHHTDWGQPFNVDDAGSAAVREFLRTNAAYWIDEFHLDGLRLDATQDVHDDSEHHILAEIVQAARDAAAGRRLWIVAENEPQRAQLARPLDRGGFGIDALWNDDFHHSAMVLISGRNEAYYSDHAAKAQEFVSAIKYGFLYQGQWYHWQGHARGEPAFDLPPSAFVHFIQNHDQIANTAQGQRAQSWTSPGLYRAVTALLLLGPQTPMLFQGQEFAASTPFFYFADHREELAQQVMQGRKRFLAQFPSLARPEVQDRLPDPGDPQTFVRSKLDHSERESHGAMYELHRDLLRLRREDPVFGGERRRAVDGAVLHERAFVLRFFGGDGDDRLLLVNFDPDLHLRPAPEPLLAPPPWRAWHLIWSSEDPRFGGSGTPPLAEEGTWILPGHCALVLASRPRAGDADRPAARQKERT